ncbi:MAG: phage tail protein [Gaiellales bacterium]
MASDRDPIAGASPDPVGELSFLVQADGIQGSIGLFSECSGISVEREVETYQEGGLNTFTRKLPGRLTYPNLVLKRGVTHQTALLDWFNASQAPDSRGTVTVSLNGPDGQTVRSWSFDAAFPVKWQGPTLNAASSNAASETLEIAHEGFAGS